jgi:hypothetical protein
MPTRSSLTTTKTPSDDSLRHLIRYLHQKGIKLLLKPFVDSKDGTWRAEFQPQNWPHWFASYSRMILHYAQIAREEEVPMFSIGCENVLGNAKQQKSWVQLIKKVRQIYPGPLTYAANFNQAASYRQVFFWEQLDYIGIDAYFPVGEPWDRSLSKKVRHWQTYLEQIRLWCTYRHPNKPVLFTEIGLGSYQGAARTPWAFSKRKAPDEQEQADYYEALLEAAQDQDWLHGLFWWWWDNPSTSDYIHTGRDYAWFFTPQGKKAEKVLRKHYGADLL